MADVVLRGVRKRFSRQEVLHGIDLEVKDGELGVLVGPSGCGKSTILRLIAGLEDLTEGEIRIGGERANDLPPSKRGIAMVFQSYALYPHMTVYENMAFGLRLAKYGEKGIEERIRTAAETLRIGNLLGRRPKELSGGQRQRVAMGRAIVREPKVFLFDEPLSNLDASLRVEMRVEIARLRDELGTTMIYVTHDQVEAMTLGDQIAVLREGRLEQAGPPLDVYAYPRNMFVAGFIGSPGMNFLPCRVGEAKLNGITVVLTGGATITVPAESDGIQQEESLTLGIRPESLILDSRGEARLTGRVVAAERLGAETYIHLRLGGNLALLIKAPGGASHSRGDELTVGLAGRDCHLFGKDGHALPPANDRGR